MTTSPLSSLMTLTAPRTGRFLMPDPSGWNLVVVPVWLVVGVRVLWWELLMVRRLWRELRR